MLDSKKEQRWRNVEQWANEVTDGVGCLIDAGILETVIVLNVMRVHTLASCQGHIERGIGAPWVEISAENARTVADIALQKLWKSEEQKDRQRRTVLRDEAERMRLDAKRLHLVERLKLVTYLDSFYEKRVTSFENHLIFNQTVWTGSILLESQGADSQERLSEEEQAEKLVCYQEEMQSFTAFLKKLYFEEKE